jgi:hypothetical protein
MKHIASLAGRVGSSRTASPGVSRTNSRASSPCRWADPELLTVVVREVEKVTQVPRARIAEIAADQEHLADLVLRAYTARRSRCIGLGAALRLAGSRFYQSVDLDDDASVVRGADLAKLTSRYLVDQIKHCGRVEVLANREIVTLEGGRDWLRGQIAVDDHYPLLTGRGVPRDNR